MSLDKKRVLALNPFHGGSHKAFIEAWIKRSCHDWELLTLPGKRWKWRLQYAAVEFSHRVKELVEEGKCWDLVFCTSMMNIAEFKALSGLNIPIITYFHENQLTYPASRYQHFDVNAALTNIKSAYASDAVWFNSYFHKNDFLFAAKELLEKKNQSCEFLKYVEAKASVQYQAVADEFFTDRENQFSSPIKLVWAARWEEEKNPGLLFLALRRLKEYGVPFEIAVLGEEMYTRLPCFDEAQKEFEQEITHFGYAESIESYRKVLSESDVFISTADHEFFGVAAVEAVASGCIPVVPDHLAYPDVLEDFKEFFYKYRSSVSLAKTIEKIVEKKPVLKYDVEQYSWKNRISFLDKALVM